MASIKKEISNFWPEAEPSIESLTFSDFIPANYNDVWTPRPYQERIIALGDVSLATSPQLGQGCTMALLDSWVLVECLNDETVLNESLKNGGTCENTNWPMYVSLAAY